MESGSGLDSFLTTTHWTVVADEGGGIIEVALTRCSAWYITKSGEVWSAFNFAFSNNISSENKADVKMENDCLSGSSLKIASIFY